MHVIAKVHVSLHVQEPETPSLDEYNKDAEGKVLTDARDIEFAKHVESARRRVIAYPLSYNVAGKRNVTDLDDAKRLGESIRNYVQSAFDSLSIGKHEGNHVPKMELAKGGNGVGPQVFKTMAETRAALGPTFPQAEAPAGATVITPVTKTTLAPPPTSSVKNGKNGHAPFNGIKKRNGNGVK